MAAASYDFFFTRPYQSLKIDKADDIGTTLLLLVIGLVVAELVQLTHRTRRAHRRSSDQIVRLHRVAELVASGTPRPDVIDAVETELTELLGLTSCTFEQPPFDSELPTLERNGAIEGGHDAGSTTSSASRPRDARSLCSTAARWWAGSCSRPSTMWACRSSTAS